jgi:hypothetical protein
VAGQAADTQAQNLTLNNFTSAWNRLIATAVEQGYISERVPVPKLTSKGEKGKTRPAFSREEIEQLLAFMTDWQNKGRMSVEREIRPLLRDYIEMLLYTGMRHGTEAMGIGGGIWSGTQRMVCVIACVGGWKNWWTLAYCQAQGSGCAAYGYTQDSKTLISCAFEDVCYTGCRTCCSLQ